MPRRPIATVRDGVLIRVAGEAPISLDTPAWYAWLDAPGVTSFSFPHAVGSLTLRREARPGGHYWYAFQTRGGRLHKRYLGRSRALSQERLAAAARDLLAEPPQRPSPEPLLATRVTPLPLPADVFARDRLLAHLSATPHGATTLICAPAGYGKSSLVSAWAAHSAQPVAWLSLSAEDSDPARFWSGVLAALDRVCPDIAPHLALALQSARPPAPAAVAATLIGALDGLAAPVALILDDYHEVRADAVHTSFALLLERLPPTARLIVTSRELPPLPLARLRAGGKLRDLTLADLRFTREEAVRLVAVTAGRRLDDAQASALYERAEGWPAALRLAGLAARDRGDASLLPEHQDATAATLLAYLSDEVLRRQPAELRDALIQTAVPAQISPALCAALLQLPGGATEGAVLLDRIARAGLFLTPIGTDGQWYRYHALFADLLGAELALRRPEQIAALHLRAAQWYAAAGLVPDAITHALAAPDVGLAAELIGGAVETTLFDRGQFATVGRWLAALPAEVVRAHPRLSAYDALLHTVDRRLAAAEARLAAAREALSRGPWPDHLHGEVALVASILAEVSGDLVRSRSEAEVGAALLPRDALGLRCIAEMQRSTALREVDLPQAEHAIRRALDLAHSAGRVYLQLFTSQVLCEVQLRAGQLRAALRTVHQAAALVARHGLEHAPHTGYLAALHGMVLGRQGRLAEAAEHLARALVLGTESGHVGLQRYAHLGLAQVVHWRGDDRQAALHLDAADSTAAARPSGAHASAVALRAWFALGRGDRAVAAGLEGELVSSLGAAGGGIPSSGALAAAALARLYLSEGRPQEALARLAPARAEVAAAGRLGEAIDLLALEALVHAALGDPAAAQNALTQALVSAAPEGAAQPFFELGEPMRRLLMALPRDGAGYGCARRLLAAWPAARTMPPASALPSLTAREREVLALVAEGRDVAGIAAALVLAEGTVRAYLKRLYARFGVHSRAELAAVARPSPHGW